MRDDRDTFDPGDFAPSIATQRASRPPTNWRVTLTLAALLAFGAVCMVMAAVAQLRGVL